jgi:branched-subunit amino acid ABC-type transport system permease component
VRQVLQLALDGLAFGGLVFLLAAGLSVIFGLMDVLNLAHGSFYMLGAYAGVSVLQATGSFWLALLIAPLCLAVIGALMETVLFRRVYGQGHLSQVLLTFGFTLIFVDLVRWGYGPETRSIPAPSALGGVASFLGVRYPLYRLFVIGVAAALAVAMIVFWRRSRVGAILRAAVVDRQMVGMLGIDVNRVFTLTFSAGAALAGFAGVIAGPYLSVYPGMDDVVLVLALVVVVIGGLGSIEGAVVGAVILGMANSFGTFYLQQFAVSLVFAVMAVILLVRPTGLFGIGR